MTPIIFRPQNASLGPSKDASNKLFDKTKQLIVDALLCHEYSDADQARVDWGRVSVMELATSATSQVVLS